MVKGLPRDEAPAGLPEDSEVGSHVLPLSLCYGERDGQEQSTGDQYDEPGSPPKRKYFHTPRDEELEPPAGDQLVRSVIRACAQDVAGSSARRGSSPVLLPLLCDSG